ncbi:uncharacterized protein VSU04_014606 [Chlamydotis macqueenii]
MDPAVPKATLKVLGLCAGLLVLVAAVTVSVAVMVQPTKAGSWGIAWPSWSGNKPSCSGRRRRVRGRRRLCDGSWPRPAVTARSSTPAWHRAGSGWPGWRPTRRHWGTRCWPCGASGLSWPVARRPCKGSWRGARSRCWGCGSGWRRQRSSGERCGHAGSGARPGRRSSKPPCEGTQPRSMCCGSGRGTERLGAGAPHPGRAEAPQPPDPLPARGWGPGPPHPAPPSPSFPVPQRPLALGRSSGSA